MAFLKPKCKRFDAQEPTRSPGTCCHLSIPDLSPSGHYQDCKQWAGKLQNELGVSLDPHSHLSGLLAQV